jgi:hypothetical protein
LVANLLAASFYKEISSVINDTDGNAQEVAMGYTHPLAMTTGETRFETGTKPHPGNHGRQ